MYPPLVSCSPRSPGLPLAHRPRSPVAHSHYTELDLERYFTRGTTHQSVVVGTRTDHILVALWSMTNLQR